MRKKLFILKTFNFKHSVSTSTTLSTGNDRRDLVKFNSNGKTVDINQELEML